MVRKGHWVPPRPWGRVAADDPRDPEERCAVRRLWGRRGGRPGALAKGGGTLVWVLEGGRVAGSVPSFPSKHNGEGNHRFLTAGGGWFGLLDSSCKPAGAWSAPILFFFNFSPFVYSLDPCGRTFFLKLVWKFPMVHLIPWMQQTSPSLSPGLQNPHGFQGPRGRPHQPRRGEAAHRIRDDSPGA